MAIIFSQGFLAPWRLALLCPLKLIIAGRAFRCASFASHARMVKKKRIIKGKPLNENRIVEKVEKKKPPPAKAAKEMMEREELKQPIPEAIPEIIPEATRATTSSSMKVTVVGTGHVGMAVVISCLLRGITDQLCLIRQDKNKLKGEIMDLLHGGIFMMEPKICGSVDYQESADSAVCIVAAGSRITEKETKEDELSKNIQIFKEVIPNLVKHSPNTVLLIVSEPVDVLTYVAWKISGLPKGKVFGTGTYIDSSRFRYLLSEKLNIAARNVNGWIIGQHGNTSVPVWSSVNVGGVPLKSIYPNFGTAEDPENWKEVYTQVVLRGDEVMTLKGHTSWPIGLCCSELTNAVLRKQNTIHPVSTMVQGLFGVNDEVFSSLPCVIGESGVKSIIQLQLEKEEKDNFLLSCQKVFDVQKKVNLK